MYHQRPGRLHTDPAQTKDTLRVALRARRLGCNPALGARLAGHVLARPPSLGCVVAGFWPLPGEIDIRPLLLALIGRGNVVALPATPPLGEPLSFHRWRPGAPMIVGRFGTRHPACDPVVPDLLLVPLLAFDRLGRRLGFGGGYYDRTLAALPGRPTIGCGFAAQQVDAVPVERHDRRMDLIATEAGVFRPE